jgi:hypothetical protein
MKLERNLMFYRINFVLRKRHKGFITLREVSEKVGSEGKIERNKFIELLLNIP